ncbi:MAG: hypothetical protein ACREBS_05340 [Nitrososphaerales archaeon]
MPRPFIDSSEAKLLGVTIAFQVVAFITLLRVATGVATVNQTTTGPGVLVIPSSLNQSIGVPNSTPQFQNPAGSGLDASLILAAGFIAANIAVISLLAYLYKKKKMKWFSVLISIFLIFNVTELYFTFISGLSSYIPITAAIAASAATIVSAAFGIGRLVNLLALFVALELGSSFPVLLQAPLNWIVPVVYAGFDIYAIYYGRMGKLVKDVGDAQKPLKQFDETGASAIGTKSKLKSWPDFGLLTVNIKQIDIGMADIAFYTMVPAVALILVSVLAFMVVLAVVDVGLVISFYAFRNKEVSPGLPIPILMGMGALLVMYLVH